MKTILITGASSEIAISYLNEIKEKAKIIAFFSKSDESLKKVNNKNLEIKSIICNFLDENEISKAIEYVKTQDIDVVIHLSAPPIKLDRFHSQSIEVFEKDFKIQYVSIVEILKPVLKNMKKKKFGKVVFLLSSVTFGKVPKYFSSYTSMKFALLGLMKSLVSEYEDSKIQFNAISPSMIESKFLENLSDIHIGLARNNHPLKKFVTAKEVADFLKFVVENDSEFLTGNNFNLSGGESIF